MADTISITDISKQLNAASRLVLTTDWFWVLAADGSSVRIPAEFVRAYLVENVKPTVGEDGTWYVDGKSTGVKASGNTPKLRGGITGIDASYDNGQTWTQVVAYSDINVDVVPLEAAYKKVTDSEAARVEAESGRVKAESDRAKAESSRESAESARVESENARANAETQRETDFSSAKTACETATANANKAADNAKTATANANAAAQSVDAAKNSAATATQNATAAAASANSAAKAATDATDNANDTGDHPTYIGKDNYVYKWNKTSKTYDKTDIFVKGDEGKKGDKGDTGATGGALWPHFKKVNNHLYAVDNGSNLGQRIKRINNHIVAIL